MTGNSEENVKQYYDIHNVTSHTCHLCFSYVFYFLNKVPSPNRHCQDFSPPSGKSFSDCFFC
uniref:Uncharacterized protein n=1 Tax=Anguilla anguilla TaxID=7936 RepID=A0A0E9SXI3_ANGAN